jgi:hypothetical protein
MSYTAIFQLSRTTQLDDWMHDPNIADIITNGRVIANHENYNLNERLNDYESVDIHEEIFNEYIPQHIQNYLTSFMVKNHIELQNLNIVYFVYNINI